MGGGVVPAAGWWLLLLWGVPPFIAIALSIIVWVSSKVKSTAAAQQAASLVSLPVILASYGISSGLLYDPIAAMPSIHVTYAVVTGYGLAQTSPHSWVRAIGKMYPPFVACTVFVTGNHYVLDAVAGGILGTVSLKIARWLSR